MSKEFKLMSGDSINNKISEGEMIKVSALSAINRAENNVQVYFSSTRIENGDEVDLYAIDAK